MFCLSFKKKINIWNVSLKIKNRFSIKKTKKQNGIYGQIGQYRSSSQSSSQHVSFAMDHPTSPASVGSSSLGAATTVPSMTLLPHPNYSHQLSMEDQGIDLTQSPGRESPSSSSSTVSVGLKSNISGGSGSGSSATSAILTGSSSCRHSTTSTTSLDSGRASGTYDLHHQHGAGQRHGSTSSSSTTSTFHHPGGQMLLVQHQQQQRFSGQSYESCLRNSYHSSSSSLGSSGGKIDDIHRLNIGEMLSQGMPVLLTEFYVFYQQFFSRSNIYLFIYFSCSLLFLIKEHEILNAWLTDLGFEEYYDLFVQSGYDMHTITRMTPEVHWLKIVCVIIKTINLFTVLIRTWRPSGFKSLIIAKSLRLKWPCSKYRTGCPISNR